MGSKASCKPLKTRSSTSRKGRKKDINVKPNAKTKHQRWSKGQSDRVRDDLNRNTGDLYNAFENPSTMLSPLPRTDFVDSLADTMQHLGR